MRISETSSKDIPAVFELIKTLRPGLDLSLEAEMLNGVTISPATTIRKPLVDGTVFELTIEITP